MAVSFEKQDMRFAVIVRAPALRLRPFDTGNWVLTGVFTGMDVAKYRFKQVQGYLPQVNGQCVIYSFPGDNIGEVRLAANFNVELKDIPRVAEVVNPGTSTQDLFWNRVNKLDAGVSGAVKKRPTKQNAPLSRKGAMVLLALMVSGLIVPVGMAAVGVAGDVSARMKVSQTKVVEKTVR